MTDPLRDGLQVARDRLKQAGHNDSAAWIDTVLAPRGWMRLRDTDTVTARGTSPLSLTMSRALKEALKAAEAEFASPLATVVEDGFRAVLETGWMPSKTLDTRARGAHLKAQRQLKAQSRTVLQLQVDDQLRKQVEEKLPALTERAGYRVTLSSIAISWMAEELGVDRPTGEDREALRLVVPVSLREHVLAAAAERGVSVDQVVEDGVRALLDGSWSPRLVERPRSASGTWEAGPTEKPSTAKLSVRVDADLLEGLRQRAEELNEQVPVPVHPGTIVIALLKDRLGEPAE